MRALRHLLVRPAALCCALIAVGLLYAPAARAAESRPPKILFTIADDWGVHAGAYGTKWVRTPNFDRVARDGILFKHAYSPNAKCAPSRAAILTGRNSWQLKEAGQLYLENFEPSRWPAGNPETGYLTVDASPTKSFILDARRANGADP